MSVDERLTELGITLPEPRPAGLYAPAVRTRDLVYVSGQVASRDGQIVHPGRVGADVTLEQAQEAARAAIVNALGAARGLLGSLDGCRVIQAIGYVASTPEFTQQPQVMNAASELLRDVFGEEKGVGSRLALGVTSLPGNSPIEISLILETGGV